MSTAVSETQCHNILSYSEAKKKRNELFSIDTYTRLIVSNENQ
jgi:hypothetical protein